MRLVFKWATIEPFERFEKGECFMKKAIGIFAHVDAGKTTFSEQLLYHTHAIRTLGRVDHQNAFLDSHPLERERGITIFSGMASFSLEGEEYILSLIHI